MSEKQCKKELKWVLTMAIIVIVFILIRGAFLRHEEEAVESAYEAGYSAAMEDVVNMSSIIETREVDGDCYITVELPNGATHIWVSPAAKG